MYIIFKESNLYYSQFTLKCRMTRPPQGCKKVESPFGPLRSKMLIRSIKSLALIICVWADYTHLCNVIIFIRPLQKYVFESQPWNALKRRWRTLGHRKRKTSQAVSLVSYLKTLDGWEECERQREEGRGTEFPQLSPWYTTPVDRPGVAHLQHQVHGSFTTTLRTQKIYFH